MARSLLRRAAMLWRTCALMSIVAAVFSFAKPLHAAEADERSPSPGAVYPLLFDASMALGPAGGEGRWGLALERHPGRPIGDERVRGWGFGVGVAGGLAVVGAPMDGEAPADRGSAGAWIAPILRPGYFFATQRETWVSGCVGIGAVPIVDVLSDGTLRLTLSARPGFLIAVAHFAFGLGMALDETVAARGPRDARGFGVGVVTQLGAAL